MTPRVTVLMTVYNGLPYLGEAIESVLNQTFQDFEFLIIDDGSTDGSMETVESYSDDRIRLIRNATNIGQNPSLNKGLAQARGDFVVRLDQDDVCLPGRIETQVAFLSNNPEISVVGTWAYSIDERSRKTSVWKWKVGDCGTLVGLLLVGRCALLHPSVAYRRQVILDAGGYDDSFGVASDYALWVDLVLANRRAAVIPEQLIMYRVHGQRQSATKAQAQFESAVRAHEKLVRALSGSSDIEVLASVLRIESTVWERALTREQIGLVLESIDRLLNRAAQVLPLRPDELRSMRRTVYRWLGPGVRVGARLKRLPSAVFYPAVFALSPLLIPGVRPMVTRLLQPLRLLRILPERMIRSLILSFGKKPQVGVRSIEPLLLTVDPRDSSSLRSLRVRLQDFFQKAPRGALAVTFVEESPKMFAGMGRIVHWRTVFSHDQDYRLWGEAYKKLDEMIPVLPKSISEIVMTYYHESARDLFQLDVLRESERRFGNAVAFILPIGDMANALELNRQMRSGSMSVSRLALFGIRTLTSALAHRLRRICRSLVSPVRRAGGRFLAATMWLLPGIGFSIRGRQYEIVIHLPRIRIRDFGLGAKLAFMSTIGLLASGGKTIAAIVRKANLAMAYFAKRLIQVFRGAQQQPTALLVTLEDNGTRLNLDPGLSILKELKDRGEDVVVLSTSDAVLKESRAAGVGVVDVAASIPDRVLSLRMDHSRNAMLKLMSRYLPESPERLLLLRLYFSIPNYLRLIRAIGRSLRKIEAGLQVTSVLTVYECQPLAITAGRWATRRGIPWVGFFPFLVVDRPDGDYFPAPLHLVYGDQLRDKILSHGCDPASVEVVGTPTYDRPPSQDLAGDAAYVASSFPHTVGKKLVVVATEAFDAPLVELEPILKALAEMPDIAVVLKLHPRDSHEFFGEFLVSLGMPANIVAVQNCDLRALLHSADLLVAIVSNIIVTAAVLGTPTLVCDFSGKSKVVDFVAEGLSTGCYAPEEIPGTVRRLLFDQEARAEARGRLTAGLKRFNNPNDGSSHKRVASFLQSTAQRSRALHRRASSMANRPTSEESSPEVPIVETTRRG